MKRRGFPPRVQSRAAPWPTMRRALCATAAGAAGRVLTRAARQGTGDASCSPHGAVLRRTRSSVCFREKRSTPLFHHVESMEMERRRGVASSASGASGVSGPVDVSGAVIVRGNEPGDVEVRPEGVSTDDWLASLPRGAYVNARTFRRLAVFQYDFHMRKLAESIALMREKEEEEEEEEEGEEEEGPISLTPPPTPAAVEAVVGPLITSALTRYYDAFPAHAGEVKLCVHVGWGANPTRRALPPMPPTILAAHDLVATCLASPLVNPRPATGPVVAEVDGAGRPHAAAKDSAWAASRAKLVASRGADVHETLLVDPVCGHVLEGASSNVFAVVGGEVYTADEGVLRGSVRDAVIAACEANGVKVHLAPPPGVMTWQGALISSTSRLAIPLDVVVVPGRRASEGGGAGGGRDEGDPSDGSVRVELDAGPYSLASKIAAWTEAQVEASSVELRVGTTPRFDPKPVPFNL